MSLRRSAAARRRAVADFLSKSPVCFLHHGPSGFAPIGSERLSDEETKRRRD